ncbi:hypothetical protein [Micromonospora sp. SH-82]|uniref:hypothetical protein n=1 Tax=Micromonospora sp. SH-82 TaxID=3132938 RepID=UPI003EB8DCBD
MSIVEDIGAQVRAAAEDLPLGQLAQALEKLGQASERLRWVRQESGNPMGVPELSAATEHAETAGYALRVAQEQLSAYLAALGLTADGAPPPKPQERAPRHDAARDDAPPSAGQAPPESADPAVRRWWAVRVTELTGGGTAPAGEPDTQVADARELLRQVVGGVRSGDRDRLRGELCKAHADVGLGLATIAPPLLRELAGDLLGHPPRAEDLPRLRSQLDGRVRDLLPGLPPQVLETLLARVCRMPPPRATGEQSHAADSAVTSGVLAGVLLDRLGRDLPEEPADQRPATGPEPVPGADTGNPRSGGAPRPPGRTDA